MKLKVDLHSRVPIYLQIVERIKHMIATGQLSPGEQLPTVRQLAHDLGSTLTRWHELIHSWMTRASSRPNKDAVLMSTSGLTSMIWHNFGRIPCALWLATPSWKHSAWATSRARSGERLKIRSANWNEKGRNDVEAMLYILYPLNALLMMGMPIVLGVWLARKTKAPWRLFGIGAVTFIGSQAVHIPLNAGLTLLFKAMWPSTQPQWWHIPFNAVVLGLTAGLCEETARYIGYRWLAQKRSLLARCVDAWRRAWWNRSDLTGWLCRVDIYEHDRLAPDGSGEVGFDR